MRCKDSNIRLGHGKNGGENAHHHRRRPDFAARRLENENEEVMEIVGLAENGGQARQTD